jgi:hypothetical protein
VFHFILRAARRRGLLIPKAGTPLGRAKTRDVAFPFRMGAGFPGDVNRTHPASIEACLIDASAPPTAYGQAVVTDATTNGVRPVAAGDSAITAVWGFTVRPFPIQASTGGSFGAAAIGAATPPTVGAIDVCRSGYMMSVLNVGSAQPTKGAPVYIWYAATSGNHIQGGLETQNTGGSTLQLDPNRYSFNGPADANGNVEVCVNV